MKWSEGRAIINNNNVERVEGVDHSIEIVDTREIQNMTWEVCKKMEEWTPSSYYGSLLEDDTWKVRRLFQRNRNYSHEISKIFHSLFPNNCK